MAVLLNQPYRGPDLVYSPARSAISFGRQVALKRVNGSSIAFSDGGGYYAHLGVFHELHCLKRVRQFIHKDYYHPYISDEARQLDALHTGQFVHRISFSG